MEIKTTKEIFHRWYADNIHDNEKWVRVDDIKIVLKKIISMETTEEQTIALVKLNAELSQSSPDKSPKSMQDSSESGRDIVVLAGKKLSLRF